MTVLLLGCGGVTRGDGAESGGSGGGSAASGGGSTASGGGSAASGGASPATGGMPSSSGGAGPSLPDCTNPVARGTACSVNAAHCGGPCSNSWQVENVCKNGVWEDVGVVACGPDADHAPACKNSFSGGQLTPCCPSDKLDCPGKPDGYPGFGCTPGSGSFCSCSCSGGEQLCGC